MQKIIPAILTADPAELKEKLALFQGKSNWMHIDIMDGVFVPNISVSLLSLQYAYEFFNLEVHLMVSEPEKYFEDCAEQGVKRVIFHAEAADQLEKVLAASGRFPFQRGVALSPGTPASIVLSCSEKMDVVLVMGVVPGFQGQNLIPTSFRILRDLKGIGALVGIDGGVKEENLKQVLEAGADYAVVGSEIMKTQDPVGVFFRLQEIASRDGGVEK